MYLRKVHQSKFGQRILNYNLCVHLKSNIRVSRQPTIHMIILIVIQDIPATQAPPLFENLVFYVEIMNGRYNISSYSESRFVFWTTIFCMIATYNYSFHLIIWNNDYMETASYIKAVMQQIYIQFYLDLKKIFCFLSSYNLQVLMFVCPTVWF